MNAVLSTFLKLGNYDVTTISWQYIRVRNWFQQMIQIVFINYLLLNIVFHVQIVFTENKLEDVCITQHLCILQHVTFIFANGASDIKVVRGHGRFTPVPQYLWSWKQLPSLIFLSDEIRWFWKIHFLYILNTITSIAWQWHFKLLM